MAKRIPPDAFDAYFAMGMARSYQTLAESYGVSKKAITLMAKREGWQKRILDLEAKAREASTKKIAESLEERNERNLTRLRFIQAKAMETLKNQPIKEVMDAVKAFHSSLREERVILGEPTDRTAVSIEDTIKREYERWMVSQPEEEVVRDERDDETEDPQ